MHQVSLLGRLTTKGYCCYLPLEKNRAALFIIVKRTHTHNIHAHTHSARTHTHTLAAYLLSLLILCTLAHPLWLRRQVVSFMSHKGWPPPLIKKAEFMFHVTPGLATPSKEQGRMHVL